MKIPQAHRLTQTQRKIQKGTGIRAAGTVGCVRAVCPAWLTCCAAVLFSMVHAGWELSSASHVFDAAFHWGSIAGALYQRCSHCGLVFEVQRLQAHESECKDDAVRLDNCVASSCIILP